MKTHRFLLAGLFVFTASAAEPDFPEAGAPYLAVYRWGTGNKVGGASNPGFRATASSW